MDTDLVTRAQRGDEEAFACLARYHQDPGQKDLGWIIDVEGPPVVIDAAYYDGTSAADMAELQAILDSIQIEPAP